jgi:hypothetical protein
MIRPGRLIREKRSTFIRPTKPQLEQDRVVLGLGGTNGNGQARCGGAWFAITLGLCGE